jgi:hypothetical protein
MIEKMVVAKLDRVGKTMAKFNYWKGTESD